MSKPIRLTEWVDDEHCSMRCIAGTDPSVIANRVAFIEKTPRVRINAFNATLGESEDFKNWSEGPKGCAPEYGRYSLHGIGATSNCSKWAMNWACAHPLQENKKAPIERIIPFQTLLRFGIEL